MDFIFLKQKQSGRYLTSHQPWKVTVQGQALWLSGSDEPHRREAEISTYYRIWRLGSITEHNDCDEHFQLLKWENQVGPGEVTVVHTGNVRHPGFYTDVPSALPGCRPQPLKRPVPSPLQNHAEQNYGQSVMLFYFALSFSCTQGMHHVNYISVLHIQVNTFALLQSDSHLGLPPTYSGSVSPSESIYGSHKAEETVSFSAPALPQLMHISTQA